MINYYLNIIKPNIVLGNLFTVLGGYFLATSKYNFNFFNLFFVLLGVSFIISSSCVFNNIIDRDIDFKMSRTKNRVSLNKNYSFIKTFLYGILLLILGIYFLLYYVNLFCTFLALLGFVIYIFIYSLYMKRKYLSSIIVGSFAGAIPPLIGYCSLNKIDFCSFLLFIILVFWQIPHFYSISVYRQNDYKKINIPLYSIFYGIDKTKKIVFINILFFMFFNFFLSILNYINYYYLFFSFILNLIWLLKFNIYYNNNNILWAKNNFIFSIIVIVLLNLFFVFNKLFLLYKFI